ncbi:glycosyltransferase family 39 protein [Sporolactobacillus laevolacticus]|uniref:glycosyltransferase family 39 protein n=1 Tax=Sporolactobacillus laevolacticus TaxID=33018 RepID=UPI0025B2B9C1|nr:glycosyltransferase family 39 protein [Sporolactobacillus laevolacticus]MDN3954951.1 glycosyltransferase family 39 protein [Sporolactobacillus laevolacticus]
MSTILRLKQSLITLFSIAFASCFLAVLAIGFLYPMIFQHYTGLLPIALSLAMFALIVILFFLAVYRWLVRFTDPTINKISAGIFLIMVLLEVTMIITFHSIIPPIIDGGHTYVEALYLLAHGHASDSIYFKIYPNNIPITLLRYFLYSGFGLAHISNYMLIDRAFCALMLLAGIFLSWKLVGKLFDARTACLFLLIALTCLPLFFYTMYFYTDTVAIIFPIILLYLWYLYSQKGKIRYIVLIGLALGIGYLIRPNLILFLPALAIYMFFVLNWKKVLINLAIIGMLISATNFASQGVERHFGYVQDPSLSMPTYNWILLGFSRDGGYNHHDYQLSRLQPNQTSKKQAEQLEIKKRVKAYGITGLARLWAIKTARTWGAGAHGYYWYTHLSSHPTKAYQYLFNHKNQLTIFIIQVFYLVNIIFLLVSVFRYFRTKQVDLNLLIQICLFGNFIFYVFVWEAEPRYSMLFTPFILLGSVYGFKELVHALNMKKRDDPQGVQIGKRFRLVLAGSLLAAVFLCAYAGFFDYTQAKSPQQSYTVDQRYSVGKKGITVDAGHSITQTFLAYDQYNRVSIGIRDVRGAGTYHATIKNMRTGKVIFSKDFSVTKAKSKVTLKVNHGNSAIGDEEIIKITRIKGSPGSALTFNISGKAYDQRDAYPDGRLIQSGMTSTKKDLQFMIYQTESGAYISSTAYWILFILPILMLIWYAYVSLSMDGTETDRIRRKRNQVRTSQNGIRILREEQLRRKDY